MSTTTDTNVDLAITRRFDATPDRVFAAFTDPELLRQWWQAGDEGWSTPVAEVDLRTGGSYRLTMTDPEGNDHQLDGTFREVDPPSRLAYTWQWAAAPEEIHPAAPSLVTVDFRADGDGTIVDLLHTGFASEQQREMHAHGWGGCLANLERLLGEG